MRVVDMDAIIAEYDVEVELGEKPVGKLRPLADIPLHERQRDTRGLAEQVLPGVDMSDEECEAVVVAAVEQHEACMAAIIAAIREEKDDGEDAETPAAEG